MSIAEILMGIISLFLVVLGWLVSTRQNNDVHRQMLIDRFCDTLKEYLLFVEEIIKNPNDLNNSRNSIQLELLRVDSKRILKKRSTKKILEEIDNMENLFDGDRIQEIISISPDDGQDISEAKNRLLLDIGRCINNIIPLARKR